MLNDMFTISKEMANLPFGKTRFKPPISIWISTGKGSKHGPRIKVGYTGKENPNFPVIISKTPNVGKSGSEMYQSYRDSDVNSKTLNTIYDWVYFHHDLLMMLWDEDITVPEFVEHILVQFPYDKEMKTIRETGKHTNELYNFIIKKLKIDPNHYVNEYKKNKNISIK